MTEKNYLTISVGITSLQDHLPDNDNAFICMAETAPFMAKAEGRNRLSMPIFSTKPSRTLSTFFQN